MTQNLPKAGFLEILRWFFGRRTLFKVYGDSMAPILLPGMNILASPIKAITPGDIVVARHPYRRELLIVKVVKSVRGHGSFYLEGISSCESTDSRCFGAISSKNIISKLTSVL